MSEKITYPAETPDEAKRLVRRVRDALNKTSDLGAVKRCAEVLHVPIEK
jgi:predicted Rdx family selenoprotein